MKWPLCKIFRQRPSLGPAPHLALAASDRNQRGEVRFNPSCGVDSPSLERSAIMNTSLASFIFAAALGVSGGALAADPDAHSQHHPAAPQAAAAPAATQTPPAAQPAMDCKAMMASGMMMGGNGKMAGAMQGGAMNGGGASGQPMASGMMDHCMKPAAGDQAAPQTTPPGAH
jgi:hypothetical protein